MSFSDLADDLSKTIFQLDRLGFSRAAKLLKRAQTLLKHPELSRYRNENVRSRLRELVSRIRGCGEESRCLEFAERIYRLSLVAYLEATGRDRVLLRARRFFYLGSALGLPLVALYGVGPLPVMVIFFTLIVTYFQVVRLKKIGLAVVYTVSGLILLFDANSLRYSLYALTVPEEVSYIASVLGISIEAAVAIVIALLLLSAASIALLLYSLINFTKFRDLFV